MALYEAVLMFWSITKAILSMNLTGGAAAQGGMFLLLIILSKTPLLVLGLSILALNSVVKHRTGELTTFRNNIKSLLYFR
jgi:hypothetical protein